MLIDVYRQTDHSSIVLMIGLSHALCWFEESHGWSRCCMWVANRLGCGQMTKYGDSGMALAAFEKIVPKPYSYKSAEDSYILT